MEDNRTEPFVSVLTPVYNGEKFLRECIESVLAQTYSNWEYVIVENCSTDRSLEIIEEYAAREDRIRIHNNEEHLPVMQNLNHAFRQISPESRYCKVVHADDWLYPECLTRMVGLAIENPRIGIVSSYRLDDRKVGLSGLDYRRSVFPGDEISRRYLLNREYYFGAPSTILMRSDLIRKRERVYDESYLQSDIAACLDFLKESDFGFVHQVLSFTRRHENTATNTLAKKNYNYMFGYLKMHLEYGPYFLTDEEYDKQIARRIEIFYVQFARHLMLEKSPEAYRKHTRELQSVNLPLKYGKLFKKLIREMFIRLFHTFGIELNKVS